MGRRTGFEGFLRAAARTAAAAQREHQRSLRAQATQARAVERQARTARTRALRQAAEAERLAKKEYLEDRLEEVEDLNEQLKETVEALQGLLLHTLARDDTVQFDSLRTKDEFEAFSAPKELRLGDEPTPKEVPPPKFFARLLPGAAGRHEKAVAKAAETHRTELQRFQELERAKAERLAKLKAGHESRKAAFDAEKRQRNAEVDEFEAAYRRGQPDAVAAYCDMVLARSEYPENFPQQFRVAFNEASKEVVVEYDVPELAVVPEVAEYKYVKTKDLIDPKMRKASERKATYQDLVASIALRTIHELLEADQADVVALVTFTGVVDTTDPASGRPVRVPLISVRAPKADFLALRLDKVDKAACLKNLGAKVSARPDELQAVKPIVEFNMVDRRFVDQHDALGGLESRPNLMEMTPTEFEVLVANLFGKMGLESKLTRSSRDGGVDAVAFDARPVLGGKVVIQAKRYRNTVGVEAVRDLYGTMLNEGANKGILVTTSGYGPDAYNFSKDKPVELIDGGGLLFLLREHAGVDARISC